MCKSELLFYNSRKLGDTIKNLSRFEKGKKVRLNNTHCVFVNSRAMIISKNVSIVLWLNGKFVCYSKHSLTPNGYFNYAQNFSSLHWVEFMLFCLDFPPLEYIPNLL